MATKRTGPDEYRPDRRTTLTVIVALAAILGLFIIQSVSVDFTQDDAYISFRYVKNLVAGRGLVFNPDERVEGYTNFLWIMILAVFARFGLDVIMVSKVLGVTSGCTVIVVAYLMSVRHLAGTVSGSIPETGENPRGTSAAGIRLLALTPSLLLAANTSFAYWSISGLETPLFVLGVLTTLYLYFSDTRLAVAAAAATSLVRPEGVLVFAILILHGLLARRCGLRRGLLYIAGYVVLMLPFLAFRLGYYGDLLPNPFYAKTGIGAQYFRSGLEYFLRFLKDYGLWGLPYLVPILLWRRLRSDGRLLLVAACV